MEHYRIMKTLITILLSVPLLLSAGTVSETVDTISYKQSNGETVTIHKNPKRTVVLHISLTGMWYVAGGKAIARAHAPRLQVLPDAARNLTDVGDYYNPDMEKILALKPDLVLLHSRRSKHWEIQKLLRSAGIESVCVDYANYDDFLTLFDFFTRVNGSSAETKSVREKITSQVKAICMETAKCKPFTFISMIVSANGFISETQRANTANMLMRLGGRNLVPPSGNLRVTFSMEQLLMSDPDVIFLLCAGSNNKLSSRVRAILDKRPDWRNLKAVRNNRVYVLDAESYLYLPGKRYPEAFLGLAKFLYPEKDWEKNVK